MWNGESLPTNVGHPATAPTPSEIARMLREKYHHSGTVRMRQLRSRHVCGLRLLTFPIDRHQPTMDIPEVACLISLKRVYKASKPQNNVSSVIDECVRDCSGINSK